MPPGAFRPLSSMPNDEIRLPARDGGGLWYFRLLGEASAPLGQAAQDMSGCEKQRGASGWQASP